MTRRASLFLLFAVLTTACGAPRAETPEFGDNLNQIAEVRATTTTSTTVAPAPVAQSEPVPTTLPDGVSFPDTGEIERPEGFPTIDELGDLVAAGAYPHERAQISSQLTLVAGTAELAALGIEVDELDQRMTITYYDGLVIWDDPAGFRQVFIPELGSFFQREDGNWEEATGSEWTVIGPLSNWGAAQDEAEAVLSGGPQIVGYEIVADTPTMRLLYEEDGNREHLWLDETGATLRIVADFAGPDGTSRWLGIWSVDTLAPELTGPLPGL